MVTCGGCEGVLDVLLATIDPGDEVVLTDPIYAGLVNRVRLAGGTPTFAPLHGRSTANGGSTTTRSHAAITDRTVALLMMSPSMPTGCVLDHDDWAAIADACQRARPVPDLRRRDGGDPVRRPRRRSARSTTTGMAERTVIVGSMSKAYRMIGWRVGWIAGPHQLVSDAGWVHVYNTTGAVSVARKAATAVLRGPQEHVAEATAELQRRRDAIFDALPEQPAGPPRGRLVAAGRGRRSGGGVGGDARSAAWRRRR